MSPKQRKGYSINGKKLGRPRLKPDAKLAVRPYASKTKVDVPEKQIDNNKKKGKKKRPPHLFKPGQSGNPGGRPKGSGSIANRIRHLVLQGLADKDIADALAKRAIALAMEGDFRYFKEIIDRCDGKIPDVITGDGNLKISVEYVEKPTALEMEDADRNSY